MLDTREKQTEEKVVAGDRADLSGANHGMVRFLCTMSRRPRRTDAPSNRTDAAVRFGSSLMEDGYETTRERREKWWPGTEQICREQITAWCVSLRHEPKAEAHGRAEQSH